MIAALPMYDAPPLQRANDAFWAAVRERARAAGLDAPTALTRGAVLDEIWSAPDLLLAQTCGYPYAARLEPVAALVATPVYDAPGCAGALYSSALVARAGDDRGSLAAFDGARPAINAADSMSGHMALRRALGALEQPISLAPALETGAHRASAQAVADGKADIAALDCVSWALVRDAEPDFAARLTVIGFTPSAPGLPFITARRNARAIPALRSALEGAVADAPEAARAMRLRGFATVEAPAYRAAATSAEKAAPSILE